MFRQKILDKMSTPDSLDQLLVVVTPQSQLTLASLAGTLAFALIWSCYAEVPVTVNGKGILLEPQSVRSVQSPGSGQVIGISAQQGQLVQAGDVLGEIEQTELLRPLEQQIVRYRSQKAYNERALEQAARRRDLQLAANQESLRGAERDINVLSKIKKEVGDKVVAVNRLQEASLERARENLRKVMEANRRQLKNVNALLGEGVVSETRRLAAISAVADIEGRIGEMNVRIKQTSLSQIEAQQRDMQLRQEITQLETKIRTLTIRNEQINQEYTAEEQRLTREIAELASNIRLSRERMFREGQILSPFSGKLLEVSVTVGQQIAKGSRLAMMSVTAQEPLYLLQLPTDAGQGNFILTAGAHQTEPLPHNASAKQIEAALEGLPSVGGKGLDLEVSGHLPREAVRIRILQKAEERTPLSELPLATKDDELYSIDGTPAFASVLPLADFVPPQELKHLGFFPISQGLKVAPGMVIRVNPTNIERNRYGSMVGKVSEVSPFPVTSEGIVNVVGSTDIAKSLVERGGTILIEAELEKEPKNPSGYKWTSAGPPLKLTPGTTTECRITVENREPITFVIPLLRKWFYGQGAGAQAAAQGAAG